MSTEPTPEEMFTGTQAPEGQDRLDECALAAWMQENVDGFSGPLTLSKFKGGQSNPTYRIDTPDQSYVLRRKPFGPLLPSAHAVDREYRVIAALHPTGFPVARPYGLCEDDGVIGSMFYIMEMVKGEAHWNGALPQFTPEQRTAAYHSLIDTLADLHNTDPAAIGLGDYGKPGDFFARQVGRWTKQYRGAEMEPIAEMERLIEWLPQTMPRQDRTAIVHGDYRIDNVMYGPGATNIVAVLDWELSTLGDPMADFAYLLMNWETESENRAGLKGKDLKALGIPSLEDISERYCARTGQGSVPDLNWYFAFNLFRLASIVQGIAKRVELGTANSAHAGETGARARMLAQSAWAFAEKAGA